MFSLSFIRNNRLSIFIAIAWLVLLFFGAISFSPPVWLEKISSQGKYSEAYDLNLEADRLLKQGEYNSAISLYNSVLERWPEMESAMTNLATAYSQSGELNLAIRTYEELLKDNPKRISVIYYNLADVYEKSGKQGKAIRYYLLTAENAPFPVFAYQKIGELLMNRKKFNKAILAFDQSIGHKLNIKNSYLGMLKSELDHYEESDSTYKIIYNQIESFNNITDLKRYDNEIFESVLSKDKDIAKTYNNLGYCYAMNNDLQESIYYFEEALKIWPEFTDANRNLKAIKKQIVSD